MKKLALFVFVLIFTAGVAHAAVTSEDDEYKNLEKVRTKVVRMKREMDKFMKEIMSTYPDQGTAGVGDYGQDSRVDMVESDKEFDVKADIPGMSKDKIDITLENGKILKITGSREFMKSETGPGVVKQERSLGKFERVLELPSEGVNEGIRASYKDGVLEVIIPKKAPSKTEKVKIKVM